MLIARLLDNFKLFNILENYDEHKIYFEIVLHQEITGISALKQLPSIAIFFIENSEKLE